MPEKGLGGQIADASTHFLGVASTMITNGPLPATPAERLAALRSELEEISAELGNEAEAAWAARERRRYQQAELAADAIDKAAANVDDALRQLQG